MFLLFVLLALIFTLLVISITRTLLLMRKKDQTNLPYSLPDATLAIEKLQRAITFRTVDRKSVV